MFTQAGSSGRLASNYNFSFSRSTQANIPRSAFNRSFGHKTTFNEGYLIPVFVDEALPGDTFNVKMSAFVRMSTPIYPIMDNLYLDSFFFAVPNRLLWSHWEQFNGYQANPADSTSYLVPTATSPVGGYANGSLQDYMGIPTQIAGITHDNLHMRAYNLIWNEWFRDQNLQNSVTVDQGDGPDTPANYVLLQRGKRHDYFTSCLPFAQKGTAVSIPLGTTANVFGTGKALGLTEGTTNYGLAVNASTQMNAFTGNYNTNVGTAASGSSVTNKALGVVQSGVSGLYADLTNATAATINSLRQAFQIQKMYERDARGGTRYVEIIKSHFGVISPDMRLQRPEYLGGGSTPVIIHPVAQTSPTSGSNPMGNLAAFATCTIGQGHGFTKSFTEHCVLIGLVCVRADLNYQQGLDRMWSRQTRFDFYWPALSHIGEQAVLNQEIYAQGNANDSLTFGYQERYAEYRFKPSKITGQFRSNFATPLDSWHLAQNFTTLPVLNSEFIVENAPMSRILAVAGVPHFLFDSHFTMYCARPMPTYSVPGLIDHF